eukprot:jgi/Tetstr1/428868/TSEL_001862.t1
MEGAEGGSWRGVLRGVCRAARDGVAATMEVGQDNGWRGREGSETGRGRMDPRVFVSSVELLRWAAGQGCTLLDDARVVSAAVAGGQLDVMRWALQSCGWALPRETSEWAASRGHLGILRWAREQGCRWDDLTCAAAAKGGVPLESEHMRCRGAGRAPRGSSVGEGAGLSLGFVDVHRGSPKRAPACSPLGPGSTAAPGARAHAAWQSAEGHLQVLRWARERGCTLERNHLRECSSGLPYGGH